jgi:hypothetical protein
VRKSTTNRCLGSPGYTAEPEITPDNNNQPHTTSTTRPENLITIMMKKRG